MHIIDTKHALDCALERKDTNFKIRDIRFINRKKYFDSPHLYVLLDNERETGEEKIMTGLEAKNLNVENRKRYVKETENHGEARLFTWKLKH